MFRNVWELLGVCLLACLGVCLLVCLFACACVGRALPDPKGTARMPPFGTELGVMFRNA